MYHIISELPPRKSFPILYMGQSILLLIKEKENPRDSHLLKFIISNIFEGNDFMNGQDLIIPLIITN